MTTRLLFILGAFVTLTAVAQNSVPNGDFENWTTVSYDLPQNYTQTSNMQSAGNCNTGANAIKVTGAYHGTYALQLSTTSGGGDTCAGFAINGIAGDDNPSAWKGGIPYNQQATGIRGYYKYNVASADSGVMVIVFRKAGAAIGTYFYTLGGVHNTFTLFDFTFNPPLPSAPDTVIFAAISSNFMVSQSGVAGSVLTLDSISFTGAASQPAQFNGDFEQWGQQTVSTCDNWFTGGGEGQNNGQTADAAHGTYAFELTTVAGDQNGNQVARPGLLSNGQWNQQCSCYTGGYPFSNMVDTLVFWYKYVQATAGDSGSISLNFKKSDTTSNYIGSNLAPSAVYKQMAIPFNLQNAPDTVILSFQSSLYSDTALIHVGAKLKIDNVYFKSQGADTVGTDIKEGFAAVNAFKLYPNPIKTFATVEISMLLSVEGMYLNIYDVLGRNIRRVALGTHSTTFEKGAIAPGVYFYEFANASGVLKTGRVVIE